MLAAHINETPMPVVERRPGIPPLLNSLIMSCLEKSPDRRPQRASEVIDLLDVIVAPRDDASQSSAGATAAATPPVVRRSPAYGTRRSVDSIYRRAIMIAAALAIIALGYFGARFMVSRSDRSAAQLPSTQPTGK
jgi:hypothetical protein